MQRVEIEAIRQEPWFQRNYVPVNLREDGQVNLDDIQAVFNDIEVCCCFLFFCFVYTNRICFCKYMSLSLRTYPYTD